MWRLPKLPVSSRKLALGVQRQVRSGIGLAAGAAGRAFDDAAWFRLAAGRLDGRPVEQPASPASSPARMSGEGLQAAQRWRIILHR